VTQELLRLLKEHGAIPESSAGSLLGKPLPPAQAKECQIEWLLANPRYSL